MSFVSIENLQADRDAYTGARAYYYDVNSAKKREAIAGGGHNLKELRHTYADQQSAIAPPVPNGAACSVAAPPSATHWPGPGPS